MIIDLMTLVQRYDLRVTGILHVGAHLGEEAGDYDKLQVPVWWVEGNPDVMPKLTKALRRFQDHVIIQALVSDADGDRRTFNVTNYDGMSSSLFEFDRHPIYSPDVVFVDHKELDTRTIDSLVSEHSIKANLLCLDIQGAELLALRGATDFLQGVDYIYTEVSTASVYAGGVQVDELDAHLGLFDRVETNLSMHAGTHGDAFYLRR